MANRFDTTVQPVAQPTNRFDSPTATPLASAPTSAPSTFDRETFKQGITYAENRGALQSGQDPYKVVGVTKDLGKYQVSPTTLSQWSKPWLGKTYTPQQFLADPNAQEEFFNQYMNVAQRLNLTPEQAAATWHKGWGELGTGKPQTVRDAEFKANLPQKVQAAGSYLGNFASAIGSKLGGGQTASALASTTLQPTAQPLAQPAPSSGGFLGTLNRIGTGIGNAVSNELPGLRVMVGKLTGEDASYYKTLDDKKKYDLTHPEPVVTKDASGKFVVNKKGLDQLQTFVMGSVGGEDLASAADNIAKSIAKTTDESVIRTVLKDTNYPVGGIDEVMPSLVKATTPEDVKAVLKKGVVIGDARATLANTEARLGVKPVEIAPPTEVVAPSITETPKNSLYPTIHQDGEIKMVTGEPVKLIDGVNTFIHEGDGGWVVSEASTGKFLSESRSKEGAIAKASFNIDQVGKEKFMEMIQKNKLSSNLPDATLTTNPVEAFRAKAEDQLGRPIALTAREKRLIENGPQVSTEQTLLQKEVDRPTTPSSSPVSPRESTSGTILPKTATLSEGEARSIQAQAEEALSRAKSGGGQEAYPLPKMVQDMQTPVNKKINVLDFFRTPEKVLQKIGLGNEAKYLRSQYEGYLKELPKNIDQITEWSKEVPKESNVRLFRYLDGQAVDLNPTEKKVATEIQAYLKGWADRLGLPEDKRLPNYITHIFDNQLINKEFDEDLAKIIRDKIPGAVYDPFLQQRLGKLGFKEDTWAALDAYTKRATRKAYMDPALEKISAKAQSFEESQWDYVKNYLDRINMRPTKIDNYIDNTIKSIPGIGYKYGQRPLSNLSQKARQMVYRGSLGLNLGSALRNLTQGVNTYAELGERYTLTGYMGLMKNGTQELKDVGVLSDEFIQDRSLTAVKTTLQKIDKGLFAFFDTAEKINRGSAYYGAKAKALAEGKSLTEAVDYAKEIVRKTQFSFGRIDTPPVLQSDIMKTLLQFQSFGVKQAEFLGGKVARKEWAGLIRYTVGSTAMLYSVGKLFGMKPSDLIPNLRIGVPPTLKVPYDAVKQTDDYGNKITLGKRAKNFGSDVLTSLVPAGNQIKKTVQGLGAVSQGKSTTSNGKTQYKIPKTTGNYVRAGLFGKTNLPQAQSYYNKSSSKKKANRF